MAITENHSSCPREEAKHFAASKCGEGMCRNSLVSADMRNRCLFAVPKKGRLCERSLRLLECSGLDFSRHPRVDVAHCRNLPVTFVFLSASDIAKFVGEGNVDMGIVGLDHIEEENLPVQRLLPLGFGKCALSVLAPEGKYRSPSDLVGKRIVTSFPNLSRQYFQRLANEKGAPANADSYPPASAPKEKCDTLIRSVAGSVEVSCALGLGDAVVDLVETGETMKAQGLEKLGTVLYSEAMLVSNPRSVHLEIVEKVRKRIQGFVNAQRFVMVTYNIREESLAAALAISPGNRSPNITKLAEVGWNAVSAMVESKSVQDVLDNLEAVGATDILVLDLKHCRFPGLE